MNSGVNQALSAPKNLNCVVGEGGICHHFSLEDLKAVLAGVTCTQQGIIQLPPMQGESPHYWS